MTARWWTFSVWAAVAATVLHWGHALFAAPPLPSRETRGDETEAVVAADDLVRLLGADLPAPLPADVEPPAAEARLQLMGVISPATAKAAREGLALIAVDGQSAKVFRIGAVVDGQNVLHAVDARSARLGPRDGAAAVVLTLASPLPAAADALAMPGVAPTSRAMAPDPRVALLSEQERFHQRQQLQFQEEERENQRPAPGH